MNAANVHLNFFSSLILSMPVEEKLQALVWGLLCYDTGSFNGFMKNNITEHAPIHKYPSLTVSCKGLGYMTYKGGKQHENFWEKQIFKYVGKIKEPREFHKPDQSIHLKQKLLKYLSLHTTASANTTPQKI
jgi:hypothetical protein